jgi:1,4-dihydroxy-2-naphthoate octaprenyltransferase
MNTIQTWIHAARLRTLPLSVSGILVGASLAKLQGFFDTSLFVLALLTTVSYQILSNFANDYGDGVKGTDNSKRVGPARAFQSGALSKKSLKTGIVINIAIALLFTVALIMTAFSNNFLLIVVFMGLGTVSILAAIFYTVGKNAYGYRGFGDVFVFLFFGGLSVLGACFLFTQTIQWLHFFPAITVGVMSVAVLNLNNMRDVDNDAVSNKKTLPVLYGMGFAKKYHFTLLIIALGSAVCFALVQNISLLFLIAFVPIFFHLKRVASIKNALEFDPELKVVALSTFLFSLLFLGTVFLGL